MYINPLEAGDGVATPDVKESTFITKSTWTVSPTLVNLDLTILYLLESQPETAPIVVKERLVFQSPSA